MQVRSSAVNALSHTPWTIVGVAMLSTMAGAALALSDNPIPAAIVMALVLAGVGFLVWPGKAFFVVLFSKSIIDSNANALPLFGSTQLAMNLNGLLNLLLMLILVYVLLYYRERLLKISLTRALLPFLGLTLISGLWAREPIAFLRDWSRLASGFLVFLIAFVVFKHDSQLRERGAHWLLLSSALPLAVGFIQAATGTGYTLTGVHRVQATFFHPNGYAFYVNIMLFLALGLLLGKSMHRQRLVSGALIIPLMAALLLTLTRVAWIGFLAGFGVFAVLRGRRALAALPLLALVISLIPPDIASHMLDRITQLQGSRLSVWNYSWERSSVNALEGRLILWNYAWRLAQRRLILGYGVGMAPVLTGTTGYGLRESVHNDYLRLLLETGVVGLGLYLTLLLSIMVSLRQRFHQVGHGTTRSLIAAMLAIMTSLAVAQISDNVFQYHTVTWYAFALVALVLNHSPADLASDADTTTARTEDQAQSLPLNSEGVLY